jgi:hypothetical protein
MAGNNASVGISQNRVYKAELSDRCDDLINLLFWMGSRIARIRSKRTYRAVGDRKSRWPRRIRGTSHVGYPGVQNNFKTGCVGARAFEGSNATCRCKPELPNARTRAGDGLAQRRLVNPVEVSFTKTSPVLARRLFLFGFSWQPPLPYCHPSSPVLQDVRRQSFWDSEQCQLGEALAPLVDDVTRLAVGAASGVGRWSGV